MATTNADQREPGLMVHSTVVHELRGIRVVRRANRSLDPIYWQIADTLSRWEATRRGRRRRAATPETFQRRRDTNIERLSRADCVIAMSRRVAEIHTQLGVDPGRMRTLQLTLRHIERLRPRRASGQAPVTFATLAGFESVPKGGHLLLEAMRRLAEPAAVGRLRLVVHGQVRPEFAAAAEAIPGLEVRGGYLPERLDALLDEVDVGLVPSVWEEAYGYAGMEFLAKGIPVIANAIGGMTDYVREGETGWLNRSLTSEELARIMGEVAADPGRVADMNTRLIETRGSIVKPMAAHAEEMDAVYREAIRGRPAGRGAESG
jgi:glycosyltransferase involved in cell wall biosynthesis